MSDLVIHNVNISYDESDERVRNFIVYLKNPDRKEEMRKYYEQARQNLEHKAYLTDKLGNEFTLVCGDGHNCTLRLRGM